MHNTFLKKEKMCLLCSDVNFDINKVHLNLILSDIDLFENRAFSVEKTQTIYQYFYIYFSVDSGGFRIAFAFFTVTALARDHAPSVSRHDAAARGRPSCASGDGDGRDPFGRLGGQTTSRGRFCPGTVPQVPRSRHHVLSPVLLRRVRLRLRAEHSPRVRHRRRRRRRRFRGAV